jgi:hypothetical protein
MIGIVISYEMGMEILPYIVQFAVSDAHGARV